MLQGPERAPARAMLKAVGFTDDDLRKPIVGIANTWIEIGALQLPPPGARRTRQARRSRRRRHADRIQHGRRSPTAITMGTEGMKASLISREVIADSIELVARGNPFDALVVLVGLRQDDSRRRDGPGPARRPRAGPLRRLDRAGPLAGTAT